MGASSHLYMVVRKAPERNRIIQVDLRKSSIVLKPSFGIYIEKEISTNHQRSPVATKLLQPTYIIASDFSRGKQTLQL